MAKKEVELDFDAFVASIENWDGEHPPFDEVMRSAIFQAALMMRSEALVRLLADKFEMAGISLPRYAAGLGFPLSGTRRLLVRETRAMLIALREQATKDHSAIVLFMRGVGRTGN